jgi:hypothetical protein
LRSEVDGEWISLIGGRQGPHAVAIGVSSRARVLAHWRGYCENNGLGAVPAPDDTVRFPSRSSGSGSRVGKVLRVTPTRCLIGYRFDYQRGEGPLREAWRPLVRVEVLRRGNAGATRARARGAGETSRGTSRGIASVAHESES